MRATIHNARNGKDGVFNAKHNDRNFDTKSAEHIDSERTKNNWYWNCFECPDMKFEEVEKTFYEIHCTNHLTLQNNRYRARRHREHIKTMDEYRTSKQTCPEETILMVGNKDEYIPPKTLQSICEEFRKWEETTFPGLYIINQALHVDETTPHLHERKVWLYIDKDGNEAVGQEKVLERAGVPLPHPDKPRSRYNNRKQEFSRIAREKFINICKEHGIDSSLETQPREKSKSGQQLTEYKANKAEERALQAFIALSNQQQKLTDLHKEEKLIDLHLQVKKNEYEELTNQLEDIQEQLHKSKEFLHIAEQRQAFMEYQNIEHERTR